jgi:predicted nucleic acid-binding protein
VKYIDANVLIRYIVRDNEAMFASSAALFERLESGAERAAILDVTVGEVVHVLTSRNLYNMSAEEVSERLTTILNARGIQMSHKARCLNALKIFATYSFLNFGDSAVAAAAFDEEMSEVYSYDRGFDRVPGIRRLEPVIA